MDEPRSSGQRPVRQPRRGALVHASDPQQLAFAEAMKQLQREAHQLSKELTKALAQERKTRRLARKVQERAAQAQQLTMMMGPATKSD